MVCVNCILTLYHLLSIYQEIDQTLFFWIFLPPIEAIEKGYRKGMGNELCF